MVDPINISNPARLRPNPVQPEGSATAHVASPSGQPVESIDQVRLSDTASIKMAERLTEAGPPLDTERVTRLKQAVADGHYPVDAQRITDSIFQDYSALMR